MKSGITGRISKVTLIAIAALASCLASGTANAQALFRGKFTLPYEARWGQAVLPPGDYTLSVITTGFPAEVIVRDGKSHVTVAHLFIPIREDADQSGSALLIGGRGQQRVVHSFRAAELGITFVSDPNLAQRRPAREEARETQAVRVLEAKN